MNVSMNVPTWLGKTIDGTKYVCKTTGRFVVSNSPVILLGLGVACNIASTVLAAVWTQKDTYMNLITPEEDAEKTKANSKKVKIHTAVVIGLGGLGVACNVGSHIISTNRINALAKALAAATNALPLAATAITVKDGEEQDPDKVKALGVALDKFTIPFEDIGFIHSDIDKYGKVEDLEHAIIRIKNYAGREGYPCSWNDLKRGISNEHKFEPYGWNIGWKDVADIQYMFLTPEGRCIAPEEMRFEIVDCLPDTKGVKVLFTNMCDLSDGEYYKLGGAKNGLCSSSV